jgi:diguanylate cyclase (GGDEF)-like protein
MSILSINQAAKAILKNGDFNEDMEIRKYIKEYDFNVNYNQHETTVEIGNELFYLLISQSPMEEGDRITAKLLHITDVTKNKLNIKEEKERLVTQSTTDILTNLYNKRYYIDNYINKQIGKQNRILVFVDIDDFKYINDNYGHIIGDEVLQTVAENIKNSVDTNAKAIRYGGDEFLIIIENTSLNDAKSIVQRIQDSVKTIEYEEIDRKKITLSIGICEGEEDINVLAERADKAMYYSKTHGKNRTAIYSKENIN